MIVAQKAVFISLLVMLQYLNLKIQNKCSANCLYNCEHKRYFVIDQQIARDFVHYIECFPIPLPFYATEIINLFFE